MDIKPKQWGQKIGKGMRARGQEQSVGLSF